MSTFIKAARFVGDLDDDFYADELHRDIWNEASAVGFQCLLWIGLIAGALLPFTAGVTGAWIALGIFIALTVVSQVVVGYTRARGVDMYTAQKLWRSRTVLAGALMALSGCGALVRLLVHYGGGEMEAVGTGAVVGLPLGVAAAVIGVTMHKRRQREAERAAELADRKAFDTDE